MYLEPLQIVSYGFYDVLMTEELSLGYYMSATDWVYKDSVKSKVLCMHFFDALAQQINFTASCLQHSTCISFCNAGHSDVVVQSMWRKGNLKPHRFPWTGKHQPLMLISHVSGAWIDGQASILRRGGGSSIKTRLILGWGPRQLLCCCVKQIMWFPDKSSLHTSLQQRPTVR